MARKVLNFQDCSICADLNELVKSALATHDKQQIADAKAKRVAHHLEQRNERLSYYKNREAGRTGYTSSGKSCASLIFDKWDSAKTTVPFFVQPPGAWWSKLSHDALEQHVLGFLLHGIPNEAFLFTFNGAVKGDANSNIEGLRRVLLAKYPDAAHPMPQVLLLQADNASDNKNFAMLLFLAMLVYHGYTEEVFLSFLLVGHTHEDIDQLFSRLTRFLRDKFGNVYTPQDFQVAMQSALTSVPTIAAMMSSVLNWTKFLSPHLIKPAPLGIQHANFEVDGGIIDSDAQPAPDSQSEQSSTSTATKKKVKVMAPHTFWIHKRASDGEVVMHYKRLAASDVWYPPMDAHADDPVTDPRGIELFGTPPPDPMSQPPEEVALFTAAVCQCTFDRCCGSHTWCTQACTRQL